MWETNEIQADGIESSEYTISGLPTGRLTGSGPGRVDDSFGPGWPGEAVLADVEGVGLDDSAASVGTDPFMLGIVTPSPAGGSAGIPVSLGDVEGVSLLVLDSDGQACAGPYAPPFPGNRKPASGDW
ncbi:MAG: hypothetical protein MZV70_43260 [Desulfobacterales bacterium]|nr:hypothetical protein [Desulfobacterales bacterium]